MPKHRICSKRHRRQLGKADPSEETPFVVDGQFTYWFTWTCSAKHRTLFTLGKVFAGFNGEDEEIALKFKGVLPSQIMEKYKEILSSCPSPEEIAETFQGRISEKYDQFVPGKFTDCGISEEVY
jgi:hypothetical protein